MALTILHLGFVFSGSSLRPNFLSSSAAKAEERPSECKWWIAGSFSSVSMWMGAASGLEKTPSKPGAAPSPRPKEPWERRFKAMEALFTSRMVLEGEGGGREGGQEREEGLGRASMWSGERAGWRQFAKRYAILAHFIHTVAPPLLQPQPRLTAPGRDHDRRSPCCPHG